MHKITPVGVVLTKTLILLLAIELGFTVAVKSFDRKPLVKLPAQIGAWTFQSTRRPISDAQRDYPRQVTALYLNGDQEPIRVDLALVQSANGLRAPQRYLEDADGRQLLSAIDYLKYNGKEAFSLSVLQGEDQDLISVHWYQPAGGEPHAAISGITSEAARALAAKRHLYVCDVWMQVHGKIDGAKIRLLLQKFANTLADTVKNGG